MRNLFNKATGTAIAITAAAVLGSGSALAIHEGPSAAHVRVAEDSCFFLTIHALTGPHILGDEEFTVIDQPDVRTTSVLTPDGKGTITSTFSCSAKFTGEFPEDLPPHAMIFSGGDPILEPELSYSVCETLLGFTFDWTQVLTPNGRVSLTCHFNPNSTVLPLPE